MLGLHSPKAARLVYCTLLYVLSLALAASAHLSPPLLQLNMSAPRWQTAPGYSHWSPFLSVAIVFVISQNNKVSSQNYPAFFFLEIEFFYIRMSFFFFFYLSHAFLSLMILLFFHLFFSWSFGQREIHYARATAWVGAGRVACKLTACLLGITLYWQCDNARRAAALLLKGLHREHGMAALGGKRELGQKGVCVHDQQRFLFPSEIQFGKAKQAN